MKKLFLLLFTNIALLASVASVIQVRGNVEVIRNGIQTKIESRFLLEQKDKIITKQNGKAQIKFNDDTIISLGKNSELIIDEFSQNEDDLKAKLNITKGSYQLIGGKLTKHNNCDFQLQTKFANIHVKDAKFIGNDKFIKCTQGEVIVEINSNQYNVKEGNKIEYNDLNQVEISKIKPIESYTIRLDKNGELIR